MNRHKLWLVFWENSNARTNYKNQVNGNQSEIGLSAETHKYKIVESPLFAISSVTKLIVTGLA